MAPDAKVQRERSVTDAFLAILNSLVDGVDITELFRGLTDDCARLLDVDSAGMLLADDQGVLRVAAASSGPLRLVELFAAEHLEGPCLDCYRRGMPVLVGDLSEAADRWPQFVSVATAAGFASVHAVPMRLRETVVGALGLFGTSPGMLNGEDLRLAQALAHAATIALVTSQATTSHVALNEQLQNALNSRVAIEQAKGLLAQSGDLDMEAAFAVLRHYARDHNLALSDVAQAVVSRVLPVTSLLEHARTRGASTSRSQQV